MTPPRLLIDRPGAGRVPQDAVALGPWAFCDGTLPVQIPAGQVPRPYAEPEDVLTAANKALGDADEAMTAVCAAIAEATGAGRLETRFWHVYLYKWLAHMCGIIEDIRLRCRTLPRPGCRLSPSAGEPEAPPLDFPEYFQSILRRTGSRHALVTAAARRFLAGDEGPPLLYATEAHPPPRPRPAGAREALTRLAAKVLSQGVSTTLFADRYHMSPFEFAALAARGSVFPFLPPSRAPRTKPDMALRQGAFKAFPEPLRTALISFLPTSALEGLPAALTQARSIAASFRRIDRIVTFGQAWTLPAPSRAAVALLAARGAKIASVQHGAGYGTYLASLNAGIEYRLADEFVTWGWTRDDSPSYGGRARFVPLPSHYLTRLARRRPGPPRWKFLAISFSEDIFPRWLYSPVFPEFAVDYYRGQMSLIAGLSRLGTLGVKVPPADFGWGQGPALRAQNPSVEFITDPPFPIAALRAELAVIDYSGTGVLEILAMDRPFLALWDRRWWRGPAAFEAHLDELAAAGVFHADVPSLLAAAESASRDPSGWWAAPRRREAVARMRRRFAWTSPESLEGLRAFASRGTAGGTRT